jgi:hypothetical protein
VSHVCRGQKRWFDHMFVSKHFKVELAITYTLSAVPA